MELYKSQMGDLLEAEKSLELTEQLLLAKIQRLVSLDGYIQKSEAAIEELARTDLSRGARLKGLSTVFQQALPTLLETNEFLANPTSLANLKNYPLSPMQVKTMSIDHFLSYCCRREYIDTLDQLFSTLDFKRASQAMADGYRLSTEGSVESPFGYFMMNVLSAMRESGHEKVPESMSLFASSVREPAPRGQMSFLISRGVQGNDSQFSSPLLKRQEPMIAGEFRGPGFPTIDLGKEYCEYGCDGVGCTSQRHKDNSVIRQLYNYMYLNGLLVGIYSNYLHTHVFIRDCDGHLLITEPVTYDMVGDMENGKISTMQLISLAILIAGDKRGIDIGSIGDMEMVPCGDEEEGPKDRRRMTLPDECRSDRDVKHETKSNDKQYYA
mmetsp:Transcript_5429/g.8832  ORF Transcript_5429/g.8832 Transcript_5429/m.8832 type:complete len:382 (-) Transcript_5429:14-1159(-)